MDDIHCGNNGDLWNVAETLAGMAYIRPTIHVGSKLPDMR